MRTAAVDLLRDARDLVQRGWTRGAEARNATGVAVDPWGADATTWSLLGALVAAYEPQATADRRPSLAPLAAALTALASYVDDDSLTAWNDASGRTRQDVTAVLDAAARQAARDEGTFPSDAS